MIVASVGFLTLAISINLSHHLDKWMDVPSHRHAADLFFGFPFVTLLLLAYGWRRYREAQTQAAQAIAADLALARSNEEFRSLFSNHPHAVFAIDPQRRYRMLNPAAEALGGYTEAEMHSLAFPALKVPERERVIAAFELALQQEPQRLETCLIPRDQQEREVDITMVPIVVRGESVGVYVLAKDITEDKQVRRDLGQALHDAEQASEAKTLLVANVSHELRTPLTGIIGALELLDDSDLAPSQRRLVEMAGRNGHSLLRLVDDLLDLTRIEVGQLTLDCVAFDLCSMLEQALDTVSSAAGAKGLTLTLEIEHPTSPVVGDPLRLGQVLTNLLGNAVKFTDHGEVGMSLTWAQTPSGTTLLATFTVWDTGIGIAQEQQARLFERFVQADPSTTRRHGGVGLGLAISKQLITLMGGTLEMTSTPGAGTRMAVHVPLAIAGAGAPSASGGRVRRRLPQD